MTEHQQLQTREVPQWTQIPGGTWRLRCFDFFTCWRLLRWRVLLLLLLLLLLQCWLLLSLARWSFIGRHTNSSTAAAVPFLWCAACGDGACACCT
jgi:hypothetical protein